MTEVWLSSNHRVLLLAMVPASLLGIVGALTLWSDPLLVFKMIAWLAILLSLVLLLGLLAQLSRPRIAYRRGQLLFYLKSGGPIEVPVGVVEAFFLGQGPAHVPGEHCEERESVNLVARLSQREAEWQQREVKAALGNWCEGYVTFRGTWSEPLNNEVVRRINRRLSEVSKELTAAANDDDKENL